MSHPKDQKKYTKKVVPQAAAQESENNNSPNSEALAQPSNDAPLAIPDTNENTPRESDDSTSSETEIASVPAGTVFADPNNFSIKHPLQNKWTLWYDNPGKRTSQDTWGNFLQKIVDFDTVEDFWRLYNNIIKASALGHGANYHLFKTGVEPMWEDDANAKGGSWTISFPIKQRDNLDKMWLYTMLACIGEAFGDWEKEICGVVVSLRKGGDRIALWTRTANDEAACQAIGRIFKEVLEQGDRIKIGYQAHSDAMRSSRGSKSKAYRYEV